MCELTVVLGKLPLAQPTMEPLISYCLNGASHVPVKSRIGNSLLVIEVQNSRLKIGNRLFSFYQDCILCNSIVQHLWQQPGNG